MVLFKIQMNPKLAATAFGALLATTAWAQSTATLPPSAPNTGTPSAFAGYKALTDEPVENWKTANDKVAKIGGWREYAKQAQQPADQPASVATGKAADPAPKAKP